jgi:hypothetical protein
MPASQSPPVTTNAATSPKSGAPIRAARPLAVPGHHQDGAGAGGPPTGGSASRLPQLPQNRSPARAAAPHPEQRRPMASAVTSLKRLAARRAEAGSGPVLGAARRTGPRWQRRGRRGNRLRLAPPTPALGRSPRRAPRR